MRVVEICFSPAGGTKKVADMLCRQLRRSFESVDLTDSMYNFSDISFSKEDLAVIAVPSYGGRVPEAAVTRISQMNGNGCKSILICAYGNRAYEDTLIEPYDTAQAVRFQVTAAIAAIAEHSIVRQYASGRPDLADETELRIFAGKILEKQNSQVYSSLNLPGNRPYKKRGNSTLIPNVSKDCNECGLCAEKCPVQAIDKHHPSKTDSKKCISCMRCVRLCPQNARKINQALLFAVGTALKKACSVRKHNELYI